MKWMLEQCSQSIFQPPIRHLTLALLRQAIYKKIIKKHHQDNVMLVPLMLRGEMQEKQREVNNCHASLASEARGLRILPLPPFLNTTSNKHGNTIGNGVGSALYDRIVVFEAYVFHKRH